MKSARSDVIIYRMAVPANRWYPLVAFPLPYLFSTCGFPAKVVLVIATIVTP